MELTELYNQIQNPITNPKVIEKLVKAYANSSKGFGGFYGQLTKTVEKKYKKGEHYIVDKDYFYAMMFNKWKNSILNITAPQFEKLYKNMSYGKDFLKMRNFLKNVPDVKTEKEANDIFFGKYNDKELEEALDKYRWTAFGEYSVWTHVCSRYVTAKQDAYPQIDHRLYIDTESIDVLKMATLLVEKCDEHHLPYYFKFDFDNRDDTIVIYSSTENLMKYIEILNEIKKEHPDLVSRAKEPPVLTGKIDGWIGYGSEPSRTPDGKNHSFNEIRSKAIEPAIADTTINWIINHKNMQVTYQGRNTILQDFIAMKAAERKINELERHFNYVVESEQKKAKKNGVAYNHNEVEKKVGYSLREINSPLLKNNLYQAIRNSMSTCLINFANKNAMPKITRTLGSGKEVEFTYWDLKSIIEEMSAEILKLDPNFIKEIQSAIISNAKKWGIDTDKFCFDVKAREKMKAYDAKMQSQKQNGMSQQNKTTTQPQNYPSNQAQSSTQAQASVPNQPKPTTEKEPNSMKSKVQQNSQPQPATTNIQTSEIKERIKKYTALIEEYKKYVAIINNRNTEMTSLLFNIDDALQSNIPLEMLDIESKINQVIVKNQSLIETKNKMQDIEKNLSNIRRDYIIKYGLFISQVEDIIKIQIQKVEYKDSYKKYLNDFIPKIVNAESKVSTLYEEYKGALPERKSILEKQISSLIKYIEILNSMLDRRAITESIEKNRGTVELLEERRTKKEEYKAQLKKIQIQSMSTMTQGSKPINSNNPNQQSSSLDNQAHQQLDSQPTSNEQIILRMLNFKPLNIQKVNSAVAKLMESTSQLKVEVLKNRIKIRYTKQLKEKLSQINAKISLIRASDGQEINNSNEEELKNTIINEYKVDNPNLSEDFKIRVSGTMDNENYTYETALNNIVSTSSGMKK